jgi:hypothetical protein
MKVKAVKPSELVVSHESSFKPRPAQSEKNKPNPVQAPPQHLSTQPDIMNMSASQLWSRMKSSLNTLHSSALSGRQLQRHHQQQLVHLGAKPCLRETIPAVILRGQRAKAKKRREAEVKKRCSGGGEHHVFATEEFGKKHVQNRAIYGKRPAEVRKEKAKEERLRKYRK